MWILWPCNANEHKKSMKELFRTNNEAPNKLYCLLVSKLNCAVGLQRVLLSTFRLLKMRTEISSLCWKLFKQDRNGKLSVFLLFFLAFEHDQIIEKFKRKSSFVTTKTVKVSLHETYLQRLTMKILAVVMQLMHHPRSLFMRREIISTPLCIQYFTVFILPKTFKFLFFFRY